MEGAEHKVRLRCACRGRAGFSQHQPPGSIPPHARGFPLREGEGRGQGSSPLCSTETESPQAPTHQRSIRGLQSSAEPAEDLGGNEFQAHTENAWAPTEHSELHADLPVHVAAIIRHHTSVRPRVFPGHRMESDATV